MSGVEVFGVISGAATLLEVCAKLGVQLNRFVQRANEAHTFAADLQFKLNQLRACAMTVQRAARSRQRQVGPGDQNAEELDVWKTIHSTLCRCQEMFNRLEKMLEGVAPEKERLAGWERLCCSSRLTRESPN